MAECQGRIGIPFSSLLEKQKYQEPTYSVQEGKGLDRGQVGSNLYESPSQSEIRWQSGFRAYKEERYRDVSCH